MKMKWTNNLPGEYRIKEFVSRRINSKGDTKTRITYSGRCPQCKKRSRLLRVTDHGHYWFTCIVCGHHNDGFSF